MSIKRVILTSLFCVAMLFAAGKKAEAAFPYDMEQKPVMAASIKSEKVSVYEDVSLEKVVKGSERQQVKHRGIQSQVGKSYLRKVYKVGKDLVSAGFPLILL